MIPLADEEARPNSVPLLTYALIAVNVAIFFLGSDGTLDKFALRAGDLVEGQYLLSLVTAMFLHDGLLHLMFNMWSLWIFGDNVEDDLGAFRYLALYLLSGLAGWVAFAAFASPDDFVVGASGAISGIMGAYLVLHPHNRVLTLVPLGFFITTLRISAPIFIGLWFLIQFAGFYAASETGVAYSAHVGGFLAGLLLAVAFRPRRQLQT